MITHAFSFFLLAVWEGVRPWEDSIDGDQPRAHTSFLFREVLELVDLAINGFPSPDRAFNRASARARSVGPQAQEKETNPGTERSFDHHFFFHLIVLLQENDEKKKDDRDLSLDSHHWLLSSSCWPINKEKKRPTEWRWRQWWLLFDRLKALLSQEKIKEKVGQAVSVSRAYCGPQ